MEKLGGMKRMYDYDLVRRLHHHDGLSRREISKLCGYHRKTINKMLLYSSPPGYRQQKSRSKSKLGPFLRIIDQILKDDKKAPKKQRHTAKRIMVRLQEEHGFAGSYTIVKDYVREKKLRLKEVYLPLEQRPGTSQIDFGSARVVIDGVEEKAYLFCMALPFSDGIFVQAYPTEAFEAVAVGQSAAYRFFGGVPPEALYDNMSTVVKAVLRGKERELTESFLALRSHYLFKSRFCNVARGNEKGVVEGLVGYARRNFLVPIPSFPSWEALNVYLETECRRRLDQKAVGKEQTVGEYLEEERATFLALPPVTFDACRVESRTANSLSLVKFKNSAYSVPVEYAHRQVTVKAYVFELKICHKNETIAVHQRSYKRNDFVFDPVHFLPLLERKPGGLDSAQPFTEWKLPECFRDLRRYLEARSQNAGKREYIQVLQLLRDFPLAEVSRAVKKAQGLSCLNFDAIKMLILSSQEPSWSATRLSATMMQGLPKVVVKQTEAASYGLLTGGGQL